MAADVEYERGGIDYFNTNGGFNMNLGLSYDITKSFFLQVQYDYIGQRDKIEGTSLISKVNINLFKFGLGYRF